LSRPLGLNAQPFVVAENRLPLALPVNYELIQPLRRSVSPHDLQVLEGLHQGMRPVSAGAGHLGARPRQVAHHSMRHLSAVTLHPSGHLAGRSARSLAEMHTITLNMRRSRDLVRLQSPFRSSERARSASGENRISPCRAETVLRLTRWKDLVAYLQAGDRRRLPVRERDPSRPGAAVVGNLWGS